MKAILKKIMEIQTLKLKFEKTGYNPFHKSHYCPLNKVWEILEPILTEKKLLCYHAVEDGDILTTTIYDMESEDTLCSEVRINSQEAQRMWADITYFKRYNLGCLFNIITDDDIDGGKPKPATKDFTAKKLEDLKKWIVGRRKEEVMQQCLKIKKDYTIADDIKKEIDLLLSNLK